MQSRYGPCKSTAVGRTRHSRLEVTCMSVRARWNVDARYGFKKDATALMQEWVRDVGGQAGLSASNTRLSSGAIGVPESRLEMEVTFDSTSDWEAFLGRIPATQHLAWSERAQRVIMDGSPRWEVFRAVSILGDAAQPNVVTTSAAAVPMAAKPSPRAPPQQQQQRNAFDLDSWMSQQAMAGRATGTILDDDSNSAGQVPDATPSGDAAGAGAAQVVLDWKGDPMTINPRDKLPFKFL